MKPKLAIACQGGGALQALFEREIQERFDMVSLNTTPTCST